jgi:hypothetical protein
LYQAVGGTGNLDHARLAVGYCHAGELIRAEAGYIHPLAGWVGGDPMRAGKQQVDLIQQLHVRAADYRHSGRGVYRTHGAAHEHEVSRGMQAHEPRYLKIDTPQHAIVAVELENLPCPDQGHVPGASIGLHLHVVRLGIVSESVASEVYRFNQRSAVDIDDGDGGVVLVGDVEPRRLNGGRTFGPRLAACRECERCKNQCHPEGAQRPKDLFVRPREILRCAQDDNHAGRQTHHGTNVCGR